jgi:hypothetical protein
MVNLLKYVKAPPPGTRFTPNLAVVLAPAFRTLERVGVYLHNAVLNKTEFGIMDKRYNKNVHGPYCRFRYYGPRELSASKLFVVIIVLSRSLVSSLNPLTL